MEKFARMQWWVALGVCFLMGYPTQAADIRASGNLRVRKGSSITLDPETISELHQRKVGEM